MATYTQLYVHCVWSTSRRENLITPAIEPDIYALMAAKCYSLGCVPLAIGGVTDHVHLLVRLNPSVAIAKLIGQAKGSSAHAINHAGYIDRLFQWQEGYGAFTISKRSVDRVTAYVLAQKQHHADGSLVSELEHSDAA